MKPQDYYQEYIILYRQQLKQIKKRRNFITLLKLFTFALIVFQVYRIATTGSFPLLFPVAALILFIVLTLEDSRIVRQQQLIGTLIRINTEEYNYLQGDLSPFSKGKEYLKSSHPYAGDLDLFGEDSLFQHLNRTATLNGKHQLADWLLTLTKDKTIIQQRQTAVTELAALPAWCHRFRALGKLYPTHEIDNSIIESWQSEIPFFKKTRKVKYILYTANGLTITAWIIAALGFLPWTFPLILSLIQLLALSFYLKKINRYHQHLGIFMRTSGRYLPLVQLIHSESFTSPCLIKIRHTLFSEKRDALKALTALKKIQEHLDQRGNILVAFLLNGVYLKDLHIILRLDKWKKEYGSRFSSWIKSVSETDALTSMANYRFNHPEYTFPLIQDKTLLEVHNAAHPLLKSKQNVTNDFNIARLHQLFIVTGANMAGKSTFLRTIGINLVLAQSGNVVCSSSFIFQPMSLFTSMRTTDNLAKDTSYFYAEILRLKELINLAEKESPVLIILDEMLKGTNSTDKLNGSLAFLRKLLSYPVSGLVATHDLALGKLARSFPENFFNVCFEITHTGETVTYDYKLRPGISNTMNATILMRQMRFI